MKKEIILLLLIFLLGGFLRLWQLAQIPPFLNCDEVSFSYNAYSILTTGRDEFGTALPLLFRAFNDWRPPLYTYLTAVSQSLVGVNDLAVRLPTAMAGCLLLPVFYFFLKDIFSRKLALFGVFLLAFNPTLILLSRTALDANLALLFSVLAIWFQWHGLVKKKNYWILGALFWSILAIFSYQATKVFLPLTILVMSLIYRRWLTGIIFAGLLLFLGIQNTVRFTTLNVLNDDGLIKTSVERLNLNHQLGLGALDLFANRRLLFLEAGIIRYLDNFNPSFLFAPKIQSSLYNLANFGYFHLLELVLLIAGLWVIANKMERPKKLVLFAWVLLSALAAAPLNYASQITRILPLVPAVIIIASFGWQTLWPKLGWLIGLFYAGSLFLMVWSLFAVLPTDNLLIRQPNYREMVLSAYKLKDQYPKIYVSNNLKTPYIYFLWYGRVEPSVYQTRGHVRGEKGTVLDDEFANFVFLGFSPELFVKEPEGLFIGHSGDFPEAVKVIKKIGCEETPQTECIWFGVSPQYNKL